MSTPDSTIKITALRSIMILPATWLLVLLLKLKFPEFPFNPAVAIGLLIGSCLRLLLFNRKFILSFEIDRSVISIRYLTLFFQKKELILTLPEESNLSYVKRNLLLEEFDYLLLTFNGKEEKFLIANDHMRKELK